MSLRLGFLLLSLVLLVSTCKKDEPDQAAIDQALIEQYLSDNGISAQTHSSGLYYVITKEGSGGNPPPSASVEVKYKGYLLDGTVFDQTTGGNAVNFPLSDLIPGWQIGIPLLKKGGAGVFYLPSRLGYGPFPQPNIPANSVLIFEIELLDFY